MIGANSLNCALLWQSWPVTKGRDLAVLSQLWKNFFGNLICGKIRALWRKPNFIFLSKCEGVGQIMFKWHGRWTLKERKCRSSKHPYLLCFELMMSHHIASLFRGIFARVNEASFSFDTAVSVIKRRFKKQKSTTLTTDMREKRTATPFSFMWYYIISKLFT